MMKIQILLKLQYKTKIVFISNKFEIANRKREKMIFVIIGHRFIKYIYI